MQLALGAGGDLMPLRPRLLWNKIRGKGVRRVAPDTPERQAEAPKAAQTAKKKLSRREKVHRILSKLLGGGKWEAESTA